MKGQKTINMQDWISKHKTHKLNRKYLKKKFKLFSIYLIIILFSNACYYDIIIEEEISVTDNISFSADIIPIFQASCTSCHDGTIAYPDLRKIHAHSSLKTGNYISSSSPGESVLITKINSGHPYENALANSEIEKLILWMEEKGLDN